MQEKTQTRVLVRVQAKDGMFLGPDSHNGAFIIIKDKRSGQQLASGFTDNGDSGSRMNSYQPDSSRQPIVAPGVPPTLYWLTASPSTVKFAATLDLSAPALLEFTARVPLPAEQGDQLASTTQWVVPGRDLTTGPGFILEVPGLWVAPEVTNIQDQVKIRAKVSMMCGCEINDNSPWLPDDFEVTATIMPKEGKAPGFPKIVPLSFEEHSQFTAPESVELIGQFEIRINAFQKSTGNTGSAAVEI
jgi:hypothetical protein